MRQWGFVLCLVTLLAASGSAATLTFVANGPAVPGLSPLNENPPHPTSTGAGTAMVTWDTVTNMMTVNVVFSGLNAGNTAAHIHCCTNPPANTSVATTVPTFTGFPTGATSGTYSHTFDMLDPASYNPSIITAHGGTAATAAAYLLAGLQAGQAYLNVHSSAFGSGEIRGFLVMPVDISIKPGTDAPAPINPRSHGTTPVAILSTTTFDAVALVDTTTLTFGRTGSEQSLAFCSGAEDVNGDGLADLVCHFKTQLTGFESGDVLGILLGKTTQGFPFAGQEAVRTVPPEH